MFLKLYLKFILYNETKKLSSLYTSDFIHCFNSEVPMNDLWVTRLLAVSPKRFFYKSLFRLQERDQNEREEGVYHFLDALL